MLTTSRLTIRDYQPTDGPDLFEMLSDEKVVRFEPYGVFSRSEAWAEAVRRAGDPCFRAVCLKASGKLIGNVFLAEQDFGTWELGYV
ncbi:MAG: GNAT family N-acetyltransferase, partial [Mollicutes bacterium]|nr:GNAT family N-acetyltransferase [Mollicutes bacterium]